MKNRIRLVLFIAFCNGSALALENNPFDVAAGRESLRQSLRERHALYLQSGLLKPARAGASSRTVQGSANLLQQVASTNAYTAIDLGTLGGSEANAHAINFSGQVAGTAELKPAGKEQNFSTFLYRNGRMQRVPTLTIFGGIGDINARGIITGGVIPADGSRVSTPAVYNSLKNQILLLASERDGIANDINNPGQVVGGIRIAEGVLHAFSYNKGIMSDLGSFGGNSTANAINNAGAIAGTADNTVGQGHAFLFENNVMTDINPSGDPAFATDALSEASNINNIGQVIGNFVGNGESYSFIYHKGTFIKLKFGKNHVTSNAINDHGVLVGVLGIPFKDCSVPSCIRFKERAFVYKNGIISNLNPLIQRGSGLVLEQAKDINNCGEIVGYATKAGKPRAFLLVPKVKTCLRK